MKRNIVDLAREKVAARRSELDTLKEKATKADALVVELEKVRDNLPKEAKDALDKHAKQKAGKE